MKIAILGFAGQGQSAYEYWATPDNQITICDSDSHKSTPGDADKKLGADYLKNLDQFDLLIRTPALHPKDIAEANPDAPNILDKVTTVTNEFFKVCPSRNIIGVTGTKGKGTTSTLIAKILEAAGKKVHLGGNIGVPPLDMLKGDIDPSDYVVLELANFQLIDIEHSPAIGVCLMVAPEHLDWHKDIDEYIAAKQNMFRHQTVHSLAIYNRNNAYSQEIAEVSAATKLSYEVPGPKTPPQSIEGAYLKDDSIFFDQTPVCETSDIALLGRHNLENVCAAIAATWNIIDGDTAMIKKVVANFSGLEHRLELVREAGDVKYYDDSFGTTPETAIVAIRAFDQPKVLILGGSDKGAPFDELAQVVASNNVRAAITIGDTAEAITESLQTAGFKNITKGPDDMAGIVNAAQAAAKPGDVVLLSPACASFGLFQNYQDRGEQFKQVVNSL